MNHTTLLILILIAALSISTSRAQFADAIGTDAIVAAGEIVWPEFDVDPDNITGSEL